MRSLAPFLAAVGVVALAMLVTDGRAARGGAAARRARAASSTVVGSALGPSRAGEARSRSWGRAPTVVADQVHDLGLPVDPAAVWWCVVAGVGGTALLGALVGGVGLAVVALVGASAVPVVVWWIGRGRRARLVDRQLPAALDRIGRALRAGTSLRASFGTTVAGSPAPLADELARLDAELATGEPLVEVLVRWSERCPTPGVRLVVAAATLGHEAGGAQARAIDGVAVTLRERQAVQREARALASQARASAAVVVLAPVGFAVFSAATDPEVLAFLLGTAPGLACLVLALCLDVAAAVWMARITGSIR